MTHAWWNAFAQLSQGEMERRGAAWFTPLDDFRVARREARSIERTAATQLRIPDRVIFISSQAGEPRLSVAIVEEAWRRSSMCNDYEQHVAWAEYCKLMQELELGIPTNQTELDLPEADDIKINDTGPVMRAAGNGIELVPMNFSFPPTGRGGPVFNFRSEGRRFADSNRCLIPASAFFEFTGKKYPKAKHRFTLNNAPFLAIAGIWREGRDGTPAFTMLTTDPGPDVALFHDRQVVVLNPSDWAHWIDLTKPEGELLRPLPSGSLSVETVREGSD